MRPLESRRFSDIVTSSPNPTYQGHCSTSDSLYQANAVDHVFKENPFDLGAIPIPQNVVRVSIIGDKPAQLVFANTEIKGCFFHGQCILFPKGNISHVDHSFSVEGSIAIKTDSGGDELTNKYGLQLAAGTAS